MRAEDIKYFVVVATSSSLVAASQKLNISQPTLSKSIARLERGLGEPMLERLARGVRLTEAGRAFLTHAHRADLSLADGISAVRDLRQGKSGTIRIGYGIGVPRVLLSKACETLFADREVSLEITSGMSDSLTAALVAGEVDFVVSGVKPPDSATLGWTPLFDDPMIPIVHESHPLAHHRRVTWTLLAQQKWLTPNVGTETRTWFDRQFLQRGLAIPSCVVSFRNCSAVLELGKSMSAIALVPTTQPRTEADAATYRALRKPPDWSPERVVGILYRRPGYLSTAAIRLMNSFEQEAKVMFPAKKPATKAKSPSRP